jgi:hypothetical protein
MGRPKVNIDLFERSGLHPGADEVGFPLATLEGDRDARGPRA